MNRFGKILEPSNFLFPFQSRADDHKVRSGLCPQSGLGWHAQAAPHN
jgi:hypothetical protein